MKHPQVSFLVVPFWVRVFVFIAACVLMWVTDGWEISSVFPVYLSARTLRVLSESYGNVQLNPLIMGTGRSTNFPGKTWIERNTCGARWGRLEEIRYLFEHPWLLVWKFCFFSFCPPSWDIAWGWEISCGLELDWRQFYFSRTAISVVRRAGGLTCWPVFLVSVGCSSWLD